MPNCLNSKQTKTINDITKHIEKTLTHFSKQNLFGLEILLIFNNIPLNKIILRK